MITGVVTSQKKLIKKINFKALLLCVYMRVCVFFPSPPNFQIPSLPPPKAHGDFLLGLTPPLLFEAMERFLDCSNV
jgi:hypothetical protein